jgi:hypothetical protein
MHTYGAAMSPPSLVQQVWWRDRLDQQHNGVVLMVENFYSRASPTCSREREKWRAAVRPAARVGREGGCAPALPYIRVGRPAWPLFQALGRRPKGEEWGASFPLPSRTFALGFPFGLGRLGPLGHGAPSPRGQDTPPQAHAGLHQVGPLWPHSGTF